MAHCDPVRIRLEALIERRREVVAELRQPNLPPAYRAALIQELRELGQAIAIATRQYQQCLANEMPRPDLLAQRFRITVQGQVIALAGVIVNQGEAVATGPFKVTLGADFTAPNGQHQFWQLDLLIPSSTSIEGFGTTFVTQPMTNIPLVATPYRFYMHVDPDNQLRESVESNNYLELPWSALGIGSHHTSTVVRDLGKG